MKKGFYILAALTILFSCKKGNIQTATVIHDCSGQYLRFDNVDHPICNIDKVANIATGTVVKVTFENVGNGSCVDREAIHCMIVHNYPTSSDWITIKQVN